MQNPLASLALPNTQPQGQSVGNNILSGLGGLLAGLHQANTQRDDRKLQQLQVQSAQQAFAEKQLQTLNNIISTDSSKADDPKIQAQARKWAMMAGRPDPLRPSEGVQDTQAAPAVSPEQNGGTIDGRKLPGVDIQPKSVADTLPTLRKESLDMSIMAPKQNIMDAPQPVLAYIQSLPPGAARDAILSKYSGVTDELRNARRVMGKAEIDQDTKQMFTIVSELGKADLTGPEALAKLSILADTANDLGYSLEQVQDMIKNASPDSLIAPAIKAKDDELKDLGISATARAAVAAYMAKDTASYRAGLLQYDNGRLTVAQHREANIESYDAGRLQIAAKNADTAAARATTAQQAADAASEQARLKGLSVASAAIHDAQTSVNSAIVAQNTNIANLTREIGAALVAKPDGSMVNAKDESGKSMMDRLKDAQATLKTLQAKQTQLNNDASGKFTQFAKQASGNKSAQIGNWKPTGPPVVKDGPNGPLWLNREKNGYVDAKGNPVK